MKSIILFLIISLILLGNAEAQDESKKDIFTGGMMIHTGYVKNSRNNIPVDGMCFGIGGKLSFYLTSNIRLGAEGYFSERPYKNNKGKYDLGWGGLVLDYKITNKKLYPVIGITAGYGSVTDIYFLGNTGEENIEEVCYKEYTVPVFSPDIALEYKLKSNLSLVFKCDYIINMNSSFADDYANGPRFYFGVLFNK